MTRMNLIGVKGLIGLVLAVGIANPSAATERTERPNIILVMADDQGWGDVGYNGDPLLTTPNFDRAAAAGLQFERFYAAAPVCSPTRASVLTGRHPNRSGVFKWGYPLPTSEKTIAEYLRQSGYATGHFGKWHLGSVRRSSPVHPGHHGFDQWVSAPNFFDNDPILSHQGKAEQHTGESSMVTVDAALKWIEGIAGYDLPFFAVVWFGSPHVPHEANDDDRAAYVDAPEAKQHFLGEITGMDRAFGKLRLKLSELGIRDNTLVWYCSDNGALPRVGNTGGFRGHKAKVYEGGLLVPSFIEWPAGIDSPRKIASRCSTCDIAPTLMELAGITPDKDPVVDGVSLVDLIHQNKTQRGSPMGFWDFTIGGIKTPSAAWMGELLEEQARGGDLPPHASSANAHGPREPLFTEERYPGHAAWIDGNWKLHRIEANDDTVSWELYDLSDDPHETHNVIDSQTDLAHEMREDLQRWLASVANSYDGDAVKSPASETTSPE